MTPVVADTSPIRYLVRIGEAGLLLPLFGGVILPQAVLEELQDQGGLPEVREWAAQMPPWIRVREPSQALPVALPNLHRGESDAIALAEELKARLLLIDDRVGAKIAMQRGLAVTGTLGVLVEAARAGLVGIEEVLTKLQRTNFRATSALYRRALELALGSAAVPPRRSPE